MILLGCLFLRVAPRVRLLMDISATVSIVIAVGSVRFSWQSVGVARRLAAGDSPSHLHLSALLTTEAKE